MGLRHYGFLVGLQDVVGFSHGALFETLSALDFWKTLLDTLAMWKPFSVRVYKHGKTQTELRTHELSRVTVLNPAEKRDTQGTGTKNLCRTVRPVGQSSLSKWKSSTGPPCLKLRRCPRKWLFATSPGDPQTSDSSWMGRDECSSYIVPMKNIENLWKI